MKLKEIVSLIKKTNKLDDLYKKLSDLHTEIVDELISLRDEIENETR